MTTADPRLHPTPAQIAKLIRADLRAARAAGTLAAELTFSVRTQTFPGGSAIDVTVIGFTGETHNAEYLAWQAGGAGGIPPCGWKTPEVDATTAAVKRICTARIDASHRKIYNAVYLEQTGETDYT